MTHSPMEKALFDLLRTFSFQEGNFTLASGKQSKYYMDGRMTTLSAKGAALIGEILYDAIADLNINAIGGLTMGADPIVSAVTVISAQKGNPINGFLIRKATKTHGTGRRIEGHLNPNDRVVLVEDVMTTGGSFIEAIEAVHDTQPSVEIVELLALVDREEGAKEALLPFEIPSRALFDIHEFFDAKTPSTLHPAH